MKSRAAEVLIYGTGAVGATIGWRFAQSSRCRVSAVCRSNYQAVKTSGIQMQTKMWGNGLLKPHKVVQHPDELKGSHYDYIICANKITGETDFARALEPVVNHRTTFVTTQNGLNPANSLMSRFPNNRVLGSICYVACVQPTFGIVQQTANIRPYAFHFGLVHSASGVNADHKKDEAALHEIVSMDSFFKLSNSYDSEVWKKLMWNGVWNPIGALTGLDTHDVLMTASTSLRATMNDLATEIYNVATACGAKLPTTVMQDIMTATQKMPSLAPSMLQDVRRGQPMEIETLCGNIWRKGSQLGVATPTVRAVYHLLKQLNDQITGRGARASMTTMPMGGGFYTHETSMTARPILAI